MPTRIDDEIQYFTLVRAPADVVYDGIATAQGMHGWFTQGASVDARPGGRLVFRWHEFGADRVTDEAGEGYPLIRPNPLEYTIIHLREYGYHHTPYGLRAMLNCSAGWGEALTLWKFYIEHRLRY